MRAAVQAASCLVKPPDLAADIPRRPVGGRPGSACAWSVRAPKRESRSKSPSPRRSGRRSARRSAGRRFLADSTDVAASCRPGASSSTSSAARSSGSGPSEPVRRRPPLIPGERDIRRSGVTFRGWRFARHTGGRCDLGLQRPDPGNVRIVATSVGHGIPQAARLVDRRPARLLRPPDAAWDVERDYDHPTVRRLAPKDATGPTNRSSRHRPRARRARTRPTPEESAGDASDPGRAIRCAHPLSRPEPRGDRSSSGRGRSRTLR
jgi:hypothetical protein